jgi:hypothetical protein
MKTEEELQQEYVIDYLKGKTTIPTYASWKAHRYMRLKIKEIAEGIPNVVVGFEEKDNG